MIMELILDVQQEIVKTNMEEWSGVMEIVIQVFSKMGNYIWEPIILLVAKDIQERLMKVISFMVQVVIFLMTIVIMEVNGKTENMMEKDTFMIKI